MEERNCINVCSINGLKNNIEYIDALLNNNFSMDSIVPIVNNSSNIDRLLRWGCEEDMELLTYISSCFSEPQSIDMSYTTDIPNTLFLRTISKTYNLTIEHAYNNYEAGYVGYNKIVNGEIIETDFEENNKSPKYIALQQKYNFYSDEQMKEMTIDNETLPKEQTIISMKDLLKLQDK